MKENLPRIFDSTLECEAADSELSLCTVYFQGGRTVVVAYWKAACEVGVLDGYDHSIPVTRDGGGIPWSAVRSWQTIQYDAHGMLDSWLAVQEMVNVGIEIPVHDPEVFDFEVTYPRRMDKDWEVTTPDMKEIKEATELLK